MPNWSYNTLRISGKPDKMREFYDSSIKKNSNDTEVFNFSNIFPMPEKIKNTISPSSSAKGKKWINSEKAKVRDMSISQLLDEESESGLIPCENNTDEKCQLLKKEFGADNWYDWNINTYGTKWDIEVTDFIQEDCEFIAHFNTAWSPPATFLYNLSVKFPSLEINLNYELEGCDECGVFYTDSDGNLSHETDEVTYRGSDGRDIYYNSDDGEWHYQDDDEVCDDYISINPFS